MSMKGHWICRVKSFYVSNWYFRIIGFVFRYVAKYDRHCNENGATEIPEHPFEARRRASTTKACARLSLIIDPTKVVCCEQLTAIV